MKYLYTGLVFAGALAALCGVQAQAAPMVGAVDTAGGYGQQVLEKVLPLWSAPGSGQVPAGTNGFMVVSVRVGSNGEILYCDARKSSGNQMTDTAACSTVARVGSFPPPASGMPVEVFLTLPVGGSSGLAASGGPAPAYNQSANQTGVVPGWTDPGIGPRTAPNSSGSNASAPSISVPASGGNAAPYGYADSEQPAGPAGQMPIQGSGTETTPAYSAPRDMTGSAPVGANYANTAMGVIQPHVRVPREFKGEANVVIRLGVDAHGRVTSMEVEEAAGSTPVVNEAVFQAIRKAKLPPPGVDKLLLLTFTLRGL